MEPCIVPPPVVHDCYEDVRLRRGGALARCRPVMRTLRNGLYASGIPIEGSKGEAETGQEELNIRYGSAMDAAENHTVAKHAAKEIGWQQGHAVSFLPKWRHDKVGSASHVHQSLWTKDGVPAFYDADADLGMAELARHP